MSKQSDIEMLSIRALETYVSQNNITIKEANRIFHKHQIFEKIILQHEYLHQVSFDEVMEFVKCEILKTADEFILFHGTVFDFDQILLNKSHNRRDFGRGFYTTLLEQQAKDWAYRLSLREQKKKYYVYQYIFQEAELLQIKKFASLDKEWLEFIKENRSKGGLQHSYDVVIGPVADDNTMETVQLYIAGILSDEEAVNRLRYNQVNNQVSFHTQKALDCLRTVGRKSYE